MCVCEVSLVSVIIPQPTVLVMFLWGQYTLSKDTFQECQFRTHIYLKFKVSAASNLSFGRKLKNVLILAFL